MGRIVVIAASTGSLEPLQILIGALPAMLPAAICIVRHIGTGYSVLPGILNPVSKFQVAFALDGEAILDGRVYVAPPDHHMILGDDRVHLNQGPAVNHARPAADPLFVSAAENYGVRVIGIVLSGGGLDGAAGLATVKKHGGTCLIQNPASADAWSMPFAALAADGPDICPTIDDMAQRVIALCGGARRSEPPAGAGRGVAPPMRR